jgi:hypothetical protein
MGLYAIPCRECGKLFMWFSGNMDQRCGDCLNPKAVPAVQCLNCGADLTNYPTSAAAHQCSSSTSSAEQGK